MSEDFVRAIYKPKAFTVEDLVLFLEQFPPQASVFLREGPLTLAEATDVSGGISTCLHIILRTAPTGGAEG